MSGYYAQAIAEELNGAGGNDFASHGRHGQDAGRRLFGWFPNWNEQRSQSVRLYLSGAARAGRNANSVFRSLVLASLDGIVFRWGTEHQLWAARSGPALGLKRFRLQVSLRNPIRPGGSALHRSMASQ